MMDKYFRRRQEAIEYLGGVCVDCGSDYLLEFDHKNPEEKEHNISKLFSGARYEKLYKEVNKCELRCIACHQFRTAVQKLEGFDLLRTMISSW